MPEHPPPPPCWRDAAAEKGGGTSLPVPNFGVELGRDVSIADPEWHFLTFVVGTIMEVALHGSSVGLGAEAWFAMAVEATSADRFSAIVN